jgi:hypothetical protein
MSVSRHAAVRSSPRRLGWVLLAGVLVYGTMLRGVRLGEVPLWTDEAETSINALTILVEGVPTSRYLGLPIYENTLTQPWPEHAEYEFKDSSYSTRGLAIYHGWLPLYATAFSFWVHGVAPDPAPPAQPVHHTLDDLERRTAAARAPGVVFGLLFLVAMFLAAREAYGADAGWAALTAAAFSTSAISLARQARYYSATLALSALCALLLARMVTRGRRRDFGVAGLMLALLFHTNLLALVGMAVAFACCAPLLLRQQRIIAKLSLLGSVFAAVVLPWVLATGFLHSAASLPPARMLLGPEEVLHYLWQRLPFVAVAAVTLGWLISIHFFRSRLPERLLRPFVHSRPIFVVLAAWTGGAFLAFNLLVPAASYFQSRLSLILLVPAILFGATLFAAVARAVTHHHSPLLASGLFVVMLGLAGKTTMSWPPAEGGTAAIYGVVEHLQSMPMAPDTRLYGDTGTALPLMFYTGLPVQSVMPVSRAFFDGYLGDIVIVEGPATSMLSGPEVRQRLAERGVEVDEREAWRMARSVRDHGVVGRLRRRGAVICSDPGPAPASFADLEQFEADKTRRQVAELIIEQGNPMFRGSRLDTFTEVWQMFFYRFVGPEARMGQGVNYATRMPGADATLLRGGWVVIRSRADRVALTC